jgi:hypothetical protein
MLGLCVTLAACGGGDTGGSLGPDDSTHPAFAACGSGPLFTRLPVDASLIDLVAVVGGVGAPGHTLPTAHAGFMTTRADVPLVAPGDLAITAVRRTRYVQSPTRQGELDFALDFQACTQVRGWFGHVTRLASTIDTTRFRWSECRSYDTAEERVEACTATGLRLTVRAGDPLGAMALSVERGFRALDVGLVDARVTHPFAAPGRHPPDNRSAVCPWEAFDAASQAVLFGKLRDPARPSLVPSGTPRCGTMNVDVSGTAQGVWADPSITGVLAGDERRYLALVNDPYQPQTALALSLGPTELGARVAIVPRATSGRVNRAFDQITADDALHCYGPDQGAPTMSWLLRLAPTGRLRIARVVHGVGASPCGAAPATWSMPTTALEFVR